MPAEIAKYLDDVKAALDEYNATEQLMTSSIGIRLQQLEKLTEKQLNFT